MAESIVFIDSEIGVSNQKIVDLGTVKENNARFHSPSTRDSSAFIADAARENLRYVVLHQETEADKYNALRSLIEQRDCPTIVYVSRTRRTRQLAEKLTSDGFSARPYNGKMDPSEKIANQDAFIRGEVKIIVATSTFGMGVDIWT